MFVLGIFTIFILPHRKTISSQKLYGKDNTYILSKMDSMGISKGKQRRSVERSIADSVAKLNEYDRHLEKLDCRNSYSKTDHDATFMRMKEDAMNNGQTKPGCLTRP